MNKLIFPAIVLILNSIVLCFPNIGSKINYEKNESMRTSCLYVYDKNYKIDSNQITCQLISTKLNYPLIQKSNIDSAFKQVGSKRDSFFMALCDGWLNEKSTYRIKEKIEFIKKLKSVCKEKNYSKISDLFKVVENINNSTCEIINKIESVKFKRIGNESWISSSEPEGTREISEVILFDFKDNDYDISRTVIDVGKKDYDFCKEDVDLIGKKYEYKISNDIELELKCKYLIIN